MADGWLERLYKDMGKMVESVSIKGVLLFSAAMFISGSIGLFVQLVDTTAINIVFFRCLIGGFVLGCYILLFNRDNFKKVLDGLLYIVICGVFLVFNWVFLFSSFKYTSISVAISIYYLAPIFVMLYGIIWLNEGRVKTKVVTILVAFLGALFASGIDDFTGENPNMLGALFALFAAFLYAGLIIVAKKIKNADASHISFIQTAIGAVVLLFFIDVDFQTIGLLRYDILLIIGIVHTAIMYILFFNGIKYATIGSVALLGFIDPMVAVVLDSLVLNTTLNHIQWLGVFLIMFAIVIKTHTDGVITLTRRYTRTK